MNKLSDKLISLLDKEIFTSRDHLKAYIEEDNEQYFENNFENFENNPKLFYEVEQKIEKLVDEYIDLRKIKFLSYDEIEKINQKVDEKIIQWKKDAGAQWVLCEDIEDDMILQFKREEYEKIKNEDL